MFKPMIETHFSPSPAEKTVLERVKPWIRRSKHIKHGNISMVL